MDRNLCAWALFFFSYTRKTYDVVKAPISPMSDLSRIQGNTESDTSSVYSRAVRVTLINRRGGFVEPEHCMACSCRHNPAYHDNHKHTHGYPGPCGRSQSQC